MRDAEMMMRFRPAFCSCRRLGLAYLAAVPAALAFAPEPYLG
jgi:hypothetical protein